MKSPRYIIYQVVIVILLSVSAVDAQDEVYQIIPLSDQINTSAYDEMSPVWDEEHQRLYFTRTGFPGFNKTIGGTEHSRKILSDSEVNHTLSRVYSEISGRRIVNPVPSSYNQDIFYASDEDLSQISHPDYPLNNILPNALASRTNVNNRYMIINQFDVDGGMNRGFSFIQRNEDDSWDFPQPMYIEDFHTSSENLNVHMLESGHALILALDRPEGLGGLDLYISFKISEYKYSAPQNLGPTINTAADDLAPYYSPKTRRLFFASNRGVSGDFNIYFSTRIKYDWYNWFQPTTFTMNINSEADDTQPYVTADESTMYFVSNRDGSSNIYKADLEPILKVDKHVLIKGKAVNAETGIPHRAIVSWGKAAEPKYSDFFNTFSGKFSVDLTFREEYRFSAEKIGWFADDFLLHPDMFSPTDSVFELTIEMYPIKKQATIKLKDILFARAEAKILEESLPELNRLVRILKKNSRVCMRVEGHTDNVGDKEALMDLSRSRARAIKNYLVSAGIDKERIWIKGYGDTVPLNDNRTEEDKRINRRVEIRFLQKCNE